MRSPEERAARFSGIVLKIVLVVLALLIGYCIGFHFGSVPSNCAGTHASVLCYQGGQQ